MSWIAVDGVPLPTPVASPITEYDIDTENSGRSESGRMHRERVRTNVLAVELRWVHLTPADAVLIRNALAPASFQVALRMPGGMTLREMYAGDRQWEPDFTDGGACERWNLSVKLSEC